MLQARFSHLCLGDRFADCIVIVNSNLDRIARAPPMDRRAAVARLRHRADIDQRDPVRFRPYIDLYRKALADLGRPQLPVGVHSPGFVADTDEAAREQLFPHFKRARDRIGRDRGWGPVSKDQFLDDIAHGAMHVGSPETVARKIARTVRSLGVDRFDLKYSYGTMPHDQLMHGIELFGTRVVPLVREMLAG